MCSALHIILSRAGIGASNPVVVPYTQQDSRKKVGGFFSAVLLFTWLSYCWGAALLGLSLALRYAIAFTWGSGCVYINQANTA
jgi:hypothetical protein